MNWKFRLSEPVVSISQVTLQERISFWSESNTYWFYGYETTKQLRAVVWGSNVQVTMNIAPLHTPVKKLPLTLIPPPPPKRSELSPERQTLLDKLEKTLNTLQESLPPPLADENVYWNYINPEIVVISFQQLAALWDDRSVKLIDKFAQVTPPLLKMYDALKEMQLPDELMRDDTTFCAGLCKMLQYVEIIAENAEIHHHALPPEVETLRVLLDELINGMVEGGNKLFGTSPVIDEALCSNFIEQKVIAIYNSNTTIDKRLELLEELRNNPCTDTNDQIELLQLSIQCIWNEVLKKPKKPACPHKKLIQTHLEGIGAYLKEFETAGKESWQLRIAEEMLDAANSWREPREMPPLSKKEFASLIFLTDLHIESTEMNEGAISYKMELYFLDKEDSFDGHTLYAKVVDKEIKEITLMG